MLRVPRFVLMRAHFCFALSGRFNRVDESPGALPRAGMFGPFRPEIQKLSASQFCVVETVEPIACFIL
jgi:hypothetical protein